MKNTINRIEYKLNDVVKQEFFFRFQKVFIIILSAFINDFMFKNSIIRVNLSFGF